MLFKELISKDSKTEREICPNRVERILFHGTNLNPIQNILTGHYKQSKEKDKAIYGQGVYFTDSLDYGWYYGGKGGNRDNFKSIPQINDTFTIIITIFNRKALTTILLIIFEIVVKNIFLLNIIFFNCLLYNINYINSIYYDKEGFKHVFNNFYTNRKNQINFANSGAESERIITPDKTKFIAHEY